MLRRVKTFVREWVQILRHPSREAQLCTALRVDVPALRARIALEARRLWFCEAPFQIAARLSSVPRAGLGLFVDAGDVGAGDAVALYPGTYYADGVAWQTAGCSDGSYVINLNTHRGAPPGCIDAIDHRDDDQLPPTFCAHLVNHPGPPLHKPPNVAPAAFYWSDVVDPCAGCLNKPHALWSIDPTNAPPHWSPRCAGVLIVALDDVHAGEELFLDYRLQPNATLLDAVVGGQSWLARFPPWYTGVEHASPLPRRVYPGRHASTIGDRRAERRFD